LSFGSAESSVFMFLAAAGERQLALWLWLDPPALLPLVHWRPDLQSRSLQSVSNLSINGSYH
jgi:hypothetical protein